MRRLNVRVNVAPRLLTRTTARSVFPRADFGSFQEQNANPFRQPLAAVLSRVLPTEATQATRPARTAAPADVATRSRIVNDRPATAAAGTVEVPVATSRTRAGRGAAGGTAAGPGAGAEVVDAGAVVVVDDDGGGDGGGSETGCVTVKLDDVVTVPPGAVTAIGPATAPAGTVAVSCVSVATVYVAGVPAKVTALAPARPDPVMVTAVPTGPLVGAKDVTVGRGAGGGAAGVKW
jgi:hypothetical protein